jgi:hypothetical protein
MGSVAMEKEHKSYKYPVSIFRDIVELKVVIPTEAKVRSATLLKTSTSFAIDNIK